MLARFGILCSWLGTGIAVLLIGCALLLPMAGGADRESAIFARIVLMVIPGAAALLLGWGVRYVLTGPIKR